MNAETGKVYHFDGCDIEWDGEGLYALYNEGVWGKVETFDHVKDLIKNGHDVVYVEVADIVWLAN